MKMSSTLLTCLLLLISTLATAQIDGYEYQSIAGFDIYVEEETWDNDEALTNNALDLLQDNLEAINNLGLRADILDSLQAVKIFVDWNTNVNGAAVYHPSPLWLEENGYIPEKARSVELGNVQNYYNWTNLNQPWMVMHELAHAYHHRVLTFNHEPIQGAYDNGITWALYNTVSYHTGNGVYIDRLAYARTNHIEYFAELTEAYLGLNDFYPFDRDDLAEHDTLGYRVVSEIWLFEDATSTEDLAENNRQVYPNPTSGQVYLSLPQDLQPATLQVIGVNGQRLLSVPILAAAVGVEIDLSPFPAGIYYLKLDEQKPLRIIKKE